MSVRRIVPATAVATIALAGTVAAAREPTGGAGAPPALMAPSSMDTGSPGAAAAPAPQPRTTTVTATPAAPSRTVHQGSAAPPVVAAPPAPPAAATPPPAPAPASPVSSPDPPAAPLTPPRSLEPLAALAHATVARSSGAATVDLASVSAPTLRPVAAIGSDTIPFPSQPKPAPAPKVAATTAPGLPTTGLDLGLQVSMALFVSGVGLLLYALSESRRLA